MSVRTVTIDFWGTLLFDRPSTDDRYKRPRLAEFERILAAAGAVVERAALDRGYEASGAWLAGVWRTHRDVPVTEHVRAVLEAAQPGLAARLSRRDLDALVQAYAGPALAVPPSVDDGALQALRTLAGEGYTLAVISNTMRTPGTTLRRLLEGYGLLGWFKHTTFSDEVGVRKPDPAIFALTLRAVGGEPATAVHVGDDATLDVQGARAAGMRVIQVVARGHPAASPPPDAMIGSLAALPAAIAALNG